jgi:hypothetical protein
LRFAFFLEGVALFPVVRELSLGRFAATALSGHRRRDLERDGGTSDETGGYCGNKHSFQHEVTPLGFFD